MKNIYLFPIACFLLACNSAIDTKVAQERTAVLTGQAPKPIGPYSQAIQSGELLFLSGQTARNPETGAMDTTNIEQETRRVMENLRAVLQAAGTDFGHVNKTTIFLTNIDNFTKVNEVYGSYFTEAPPARETVEVRRLPGGAHVEISMIAIP